MNLARSAIRLTVIGLAFAAQRAKAQDVPDLTPPAEMPNASKPAVLAAPRPTEPVTPRPAVETPGSRAVLAVPTFRPPLARPTNATGTTAPALEPLPDGPSLEGPSEMKPAQGAARARTGSIADRPARPLVLESTPMDDLGPLEGPASRPDPLPKRSSSPPQPVPAPARRSRFFGLLPGPPPPPQPVPGRAAAENLRDDPAPDSALKRRIEKQARDAVGNHARSIEVKVVGKNATVEAHGVKLFQKRNVRKSLESLPALSGLRTTIDVDD